MGRTRRVVPSVLEALKSLQQTLEDPSPVLLRGMPSQTSRLLSAATHCPPYAPWCAAETEGATPRLRAGAAHLLDQKGCVCELDNTREGIDTDSASANEGHLDSPVMSPAGACAHVRKTGGAGEASTHDATHLELRL